MSRRYFVTGTGTGVGKTFVTAGLARAARSLGKRVFAFKPIETGCVDRAGALIGDDQEVIAAAAGDWQQGPLRAVYNFALPAAPLVAADAEGRVIDVEPIAAAFVQGCLGADLVLVEGAGGWRVPICPDLDMGGLAKRLGLPVIIVGQASLGTINHTLLTIEAVERDGLAIAAVILSQRPEDDPTFVQRNLLEIRRWCRSPVHAVSSEFAVLSDLL